MTSKLDINCNDIYDLVICGYSLIEIKKDFGLTDSCLEVYFRDCLKSFSKLRDKESKKTKVEFLLINHEFINLLSDFDKKELGILKATCENIKDLSPYQIFDRVRFEDLKLIDQNLEIEFNVFTNNNGDLMKYHENSLETDYYKDVVRKISEYIEYMNKN